MQKAFLLLVPVLISIAGCSDKMEVQEAETSSTEVAQQPEAVDAATDADDGEDVDLKLKDPVGID